MTELSREALLARLAAEPVTVLHRAQLIVCRHARDAADARRLLDMLGLLGEPEPVRMLERPDVRLRQKGWVG